MVHASSSIAAATVLFLLAASNASAQIVIPIPCPGCVANPGPADTDANLLLTKTLKIEVTASSGICLKLHLAEQPIGACVLGLNCEAEVTVTWNLGTGEAPLTLIATLPNGTTHSTPIQASFAELLWGFGSRAIPYGGSGGIRLLACGSGNTQFSAAAAGLSVQSHVSCSGCAD